MAKKNRMRPVHPGEYLSEDLGDSGLTIESWAHALGVTTEHLQAVIDQERDVDAEFALRLSRYYGTSPEIWMDLQSLHSLKVAEQDVGSAIRDQVVPREHERSEISRVA